MNDLIDTIDTPWRVVFHPECAQVLTHGGEEVAFLEYDPTEPTEGAQARLVAHLIAAAPEMFKALRLALPHVQACAEHDRDNEEAARAHGMDGLAAEAHKMVAMRLAAVDVIRAALAKVEGRQ